MEDPLQDLSGLSLFSNNLAMIVNKPTPRTDLNPDSNHLFFNSLELQNSNKYLELVKTNVDILSSKEILNQEFDSLLTANNENEAIAANEEVIPRARRPGMGRRKAQFTMIPKLSQPSLSSEPIPDKELSKDPKEFFAYFERREMAEKELKRLRGESVSDEIDFNVIIPERKRRPGLLGRRTATYKHLYPSLTLSQTNGTSMSSQETLEEGPLNHVDPSSQPEAVDSPVELEKKLTGSIAISESKVSTLLDELLARRDLDKDELSLLFLDRLQIKPSIMDEIPIPTFQLSRKDTNSRTALSNIQNFPQMVSGKAIAKDKQIPKTISKSLASSRSPLSPFAPISAFQKHIRQSNMSNDHFSSLDMSPPRSSSPVDVDEQSNHLDIELNDRTVNNLVSLDMNTYDSVKDQFSRPEMSTDADFGVIAGNDEKDVDDVGKEATLSAHSFQTAGSDKSNENVESMCRNDEPFINDISTVERLNNHIKPAVAETSNITDIISVQQTQNMDGPSENQTTAEIPPGSGRKRKEVCPGQSVAGNDESNVEIRPRKVLRRKEVKKPLAVPLNDLTNEVPPAKSRKKKEISRRSSLAAAGSLWNEGLRKSTRIRKKPLQYWKGERFLYGRLHESLPTVIGLKYDSPVKGAENSFNDKRNLKVESYVSGELEELVKRRALY